MTAALRRGVGGEAAAQGVEVGLGRWRRGPGGPGPRRLRPGRWCGRWRAGRSAAARRAARARRRARRRPRGRSSRAAPSLASMRRGLRAAAEVLDQRAGLGEELDVEHPAGAVLHLPGVGGGGLVRLGEAAAHVARRRRGRLAASCGRSRTSAIAAATCGAERARGRRRRGRGSAPCAPRSRRPRPGSGGRRRAWWRAAPGGRRGAGACRPCRGCPRRSGRRAPRSAPG